MDENNTTDNTPVTPIGIAVARPRNAFVAAELNTTSAGPMVGTFQNKPVLTLNPSSRFPFNIGLTKCALIVQHFDTIKKFLESNGTAIE